MMSRVALAFLLLSLSCASSPVQSQSPPSGSLALVCRTGNNFISYYGYTFPNSPMLNVGFKHDETAYSQFKAGALGAGNCAFTSRPMASYEPTWLYYFVNSSNPQGFEVAVTNIRLPNTVNQVMFIGGDAAAKSMFALGTTTGDLVGLYVVPIAQPVNHAYKVVGTFTPSTFQLPVDHFDPLPIKTRARTTSADYADLSQEQIEAEEARALYEAGLADTSSSASNGGNNNNNNTIYIAVGSAIGGVALGMILTMIAISYRARRHSQKHVTRIEMTNIEHQHEPQLTANPAVVHVNQL